MNSDTGQRISAPATTQTGKRPARRRRQPYAWLGASALALGVGVALAGAGTAHAEDSATTDSTRSAQTSAPSAAARGAGRTADAGTATPRTANKGPAATAVRSRSAARATIDRRVAAPSADSPADAVAAPTAAAAAAPTSERAVAGNAVQTPAFFVVAAGAPRLENIYGPASRNPANFGPVLAPVVWALNELQYQVQGLAPLAKPNQLPSAPGQAQVVGTLNTVAPFGAPVKFDVTNAPANGTVTIDSQGFYT